MLVWGRAPPPSKPSSASPAIQENGYRSLNEGGTVEFDLIKGPKGFQAGNVVRAA